MVFRPKVLVLTLVSLTFVRFRSLLRCLIRRTICRNILVAGEMSHLVEHGFQLMKQGAEAKLYSGVYLEKPAIVKERFSKAYRHSILDSTITKERTKSEAKALLKSQLCDIRTPTLYFVDYQNGRIYMEHVLNSVTVKEYIVDINNKTDENNEDDGYMTLLKRLTDKIGTVLAMMHRNNIIHGDLTTSNMLLAKPEELDPKEYDGPDNGEIVMLDFGLSRVDNSAEDKGVDLYVLERALISTHSTLPHMFENILQVYQAQNKGQSKDVLIKLEEIRLRGRKRTMVG
ncbi:TP53 regulating kinase [Arctopsyche grandis]|uniref:TP53 regulating kinase n=1 Tax=Arctopsyche grandis TaxID=121162 RepID=UPI00406D7BAB